MINLANDNEEEKKNVCGQTFRAEETVDETAVISRIVPAKRCISESIFRKSSFIFKRKTNLSWGEVRLQNIDKKLGFWPTLQIVSLATINLL